MTAISIYMFTFKPKLKRLDGVYTARWQRNVLPQHQQRSLLTQCLWQRSIHDVHEFKAKEVTFLPRLVVVGSAWLHRYRCAAWTWQMKSRKKHSWWELQLNWLIFQCLTSQMFHDAGKLLVWIQSCIHGMFKPYAACANRNSLHIVFIMISFICM